MWSPYLKSLDKAIHNLLIDSIDLNQSSFMHEMVENVSSPLLELVVELHEPNIVFIPSIVLDEAHNFITFMEGMYFDMYASGCVSTTYRIRVT